MIKITSDINKIASMILSRGKDIYVGCAQVMKEHIKRTQIIPLWDKPTYNPESLEPINVRNLMDSNYIGQMFMESRKCVNYSRYGYDSEYMIDEGFFINDEDSVDLFLRRNNIYTNEFFLEKFHVRDIDIEDYEYQYECLLDDLDNDIIKNDIVLYCNQNREFDCCTIGYILNHKKFFNDKIIFVQKNI